MNQRQELIRTPPWWAKSENKLWNAELNFGVQMVCSHRRGAEFEYAYVEKRDESYYLIALFRGGACMPVNGQNVFNLREGCMP